MTSLPSYGQSNAEKNVQAIKQIKEDKKKTQKRSDFEKKATGRETDIFTKCRTKVERNQERKENDLKLLEEANSLHTDEIKTKEVELAEKVKQLEAAKKKEQKQGSKDNVKDLKDTTVIDERQRLIEEVKKLEKELVVLRKKSDKIAQDLEQTQKDLLAEREEEKLKSPPFKIFELTTQELDSQSVAGSAAESNMQMMALSTSLVNYLDCRNASDTMSKSYYVLRAAASVYLTNFLGESIDYTQVGECIVNEALEPHEEKDKQIALLRKARNLYAEMVKHIEKSNEARTDALSLFSKALQFAVEEWSQKKARVASGWAMYSTAKKNYDDAYKKYRDVLIAASVLMGIGAANILWGGYVLIAIATGLYIWMGVELIPKKNKARTELSETKKELKLGHEHTYLKCNYHEARNWDLAEELKKYEELAAYQEEQKKKEEEEEEGNTTYFKNHFKGMLGNPVLDFLFTPAFAQDEILLKKTIQDIKGQYEKTSEEDLKGGLGSEYTSSVNIPPNVRGEPAGDAIVKSYEKKYLAQKKQFKKQEAILKGHYDKYNEQQSILGKLNDDLGEVASKEPYIPCEYEWPITWYKTYQYSICTGSGDDKKCSSTAYWTKAKEKSWREKWRKYGCSTDNKNKIEAQEKVVQDIWNVIDPLENILEIFEKAMDQAEIDWYTAMNINETGSPEGDPNIEKPDPKTRIGHSYLKFISKIKAEWMTSAIDVKRDNNIVIDMLSDSDLERLLNEHNDLKALPDNKKAGLSDAYTRYIYTQYAHNLLIKNIAMMGTSYQLAADHLAAFQNLLADAEAKLGLDAMAMPDQLPQELVRKPSCAKTAGGGISADPSCSCKAKGNCAKIDFPSAVLWSGKKGDSGAVFRDYTNSTLSGDAKGARVSGSAIKRNAAAVRGRIEDGKTSILKAQKKAGYQPTNFNNITAGLESSINKLSNRNAVAATTSDSSLTRRIRRAALIDKVTEKDKVLTIPTSKKITRAKRKKATKRKPRPGEGMNLGIDETDLELEGELEVESLDFGSGGIKKSAKVDKASTKEKRKGVVEDNTRSLFEIVTRRYKRSGYPRLLKKKKE